MDGANKMKRFCESAYKMCGSSWVIAILALLAIIIGASASLWSKEIGKSWPMVSLSKFSVATFWGLLVSWAILFFLNKNSLASKQREEARRLERVIMRAPHRNVFREASECAAIALEHLRNVRCSEKAKQQELAEEGIKAILAELTEFSRSFGGKLACYGANLMFVRDPSEVTNSPELQESLRFFDCKTHNILELQAVLWMDERFVINSDAQNNVAGTPTPQISLPVPKKATGHDKRWKALPGAPMAYLDPERAPVIHDNLERFVEDCEQFGDFEPSLIDSIRDYFDTEATNIRSFASFRIGEDAILNIDCSLPGLLGDEDEFLPTFCSLIRPSRIALSQLIEYVKTGND